MKLPAKHAQSSGSVMRAAEALRAARAVGIKVRPDGKCSCLRQTSNHTTPCSMPSHDTSLPSSICNGRRGDNWRAGPFGRSRAFSRLFPN
jgi:hypothetical protein